MMCVFLNSIYYVRKQRTTIVSHLPDVIGNFTYLIFTTNSKTEKNNGHIFKAFGKSIGSVKRHRLIVLSHTTSSKAK